jgi:NADPH:quinone reductase-like Zn-dependent oxidoreductase
MRAVVQDRYGPPGVALELKEIDKPSAEGDQVLVRVRAACVNPPDWPGVTGVPYIVRTAFGLSRPRNPVRGSDMAGTVEAVGPDVKGLAVGDEVFGMGAGTFAEYAVASQQHLVPKPAGITFEQAAAIPMSGLTGLQALRDVGKVQPGQKVLINGAGGGIGTFAVQIAKSFGAEVTGVCGTSKVDLVRSLGADHVIDYTREDFTEGDERYDVILDNVLNHPLSRLVRVLQPNGTLIPNAGQFYKRWIASMGVMLVKAPLLSLVVSQQIRHVNTARDQHDLLALKELVESGNVTPVVGRTFPLSETAEAIAYFGEGHARGKIVITV